MIGLLQSIINLELDDEHAPHLFQKNHRQMSVVDAIVFVVNTHGIFVMEMNKNGIRRNIPNQHVIMHMDLFLIPVTVISDVISTQNRLLSLNFCFMCGMLNFHD